MKEILKKNLFIISGSILLFLFSSCDKNDRISLEYYETGELKSKIIRENINDSLNFEFLLYYKNGNTNVYATFKDGKKNGKYYTYYESGKIKESLYLIDDQKHGVYQYFASNGELHEESLYLNDNKVLKKEYSKNEKKDLYRFISYLLNDSTYTELGLVVYDNDKNVIKDHSFYYDVLGKDTLSYNEPNIFNIEFYNKHPDFDFELRIGELDSNLALIDKTIVFETNTLENNISYEFIPKEVGYNLLLGEVNLRSDTIILKFPFYKEFYVE